MSQTGIFLHLHFVQGSIWDSLASIIIRTPLPLSVCVCGVHTIKTIDIFFPPGKSWLIKMNYFFIPLVNAKVLSFVIETIKLKLSFATDWRTCTRVVASPTSYIPQSNTLWSIHSRSHCSLNQFPAHRTFQACVQANNEYFYWSVRYVCFSWNTIVAIMNLDFRSSASIIKWIHVYVMLCD